jgi:hypothetical protein
VLADRCGPPGGRGYADVVDQRGETVGVHRLAGPAAGEQKDELRFVAVFMLSRLAIQLSGCA